MEKAVRIFLPDKEEYIRVEKDGKKIKILKKEAFEQFNPTLLDLGDITRQSEPKNTICAMFDLQGFTNFCKQIDPQLSVPLYLSSFLNWIFETIRNETINIKTEEGVNLWHPLPFYTKFLGDGLLILWDASEMGVISQHNIIISMETICGLYVDKFLPDMRRKVCEPPDALRCGITKGTVYSVGDGNDFVGPCINLAGRLQKLPGVHFTFARRGFNPEERWTKNKYTQYFLLKKVAIRGMENEELIYILKSDFDKINDKDKEFYHDP